MKTYEVIEMLLWKRKLISSIEVLPFTLKMSYQLINFSDDSRGPVDEWLSVSNWKRRVNIRY